MCEVCIFSHFLCFSQCPTYELDSRINSLLTEKITGLHITDDYIYLSCSEMQHTAKVCFVRRYNRRNCAIDCNLAGFDLCRGIGTDNEGNLYVAESAKSRIVKFDNDLNAVCMTSSYDRTTFSRPFGILVTDQYVFACDSTEKQICIFDRNLNLSFKIKHNLLRFPTDITAFNGKYFVTSKDEIVIIDIDFKKRKFKAHIINKMILTKRDIAKSFKSVRGICASQHYIYVTERAGRVLCLEYNAQRVQLNYVAHLTDIFPAVIAHHDGTTVCSKSISSSDNSNEAYNFTFRISKIIHNPPDEMICEDIEMSYS